MTGARHGLGLTLVEVLIAVALLGVGVLAVAGLQVTGLRASRTARVMQQLNSVAVVELDAWRGAKLETQEPLRASCATTADDGCSVEVLPCIVSGPDLVCDGRRVTEAAAYAITVTVRADASAVELRTVVLP